MTTGLDLSAIALIVSAVATLAGILLQFRQTESAKTADVDRISIENDRVRVDKFVQSASALQVIQSTAVNLIEQMRIAKAEAEVERAQFEEQANAASAKFRKAQVEVRALLDILDQQALLYDTKNGGAQQCQYCIFAKNDFRTLTASIRTKLEIA